MRRRDFITLLGGAAASWPLAARAQTREPIRRIGVLTATNDERIRLAALREGLQKLGWTEGRNIRITSLAAGDAERLRALAAELVAIRPDVLLATSNITLAALQQETSTIPIVFAGVSDPVATGFVTNLARPGGNITGFANYEEGIAVKWLELLKEIAPRVARVAFLYDPRSPSALGYLRTMEAVSTLAVQVSGAPVGNAEDITRAVQTFAKDPNGGLLVLPSPAVRTHRDLIIALSAKHNLPAVAPFRDYVVAGLLASYGTDNIDQYRRAASYVDRILKGERPGDLPVQLPTKFELVINLKTARMLGLDPPITLLARTDEVIE